MVDYDEYSGASKKGGPKSGGAGAGGQGRGGGDDGEGRTRTEEHRVPGDQVLGKVKQLIREGNVRRITIRNDEGRTLLEIPLAIGVVGAWLAPTFAAIGAVAALVTNCSIVVERVDD